MCLSIQSTHLLTIRQHDLSVHLVSSPSVPLAVRQHDVSIHPVKPSDHQAAWHVYPSSQLNICPSGSKAAWCVYPSSQLTFWPSGSMTCLSIQSAWSVCQSSQFTICPSGSIVLSIHPENLNPAIRQKLLNEVCWKDRRWRSISINFSQISSFDLLVEQVKLTSVLHCIAFSTWASCEKCCMFYDLFLSGCEDLLFVSHYITHSDYWLLRNMYR